MEQIITTSRVVLGGREVDLMTFDGAVELISTRASSFCPAPLAVVSVNLDHINHFGAGGSRSGRDTGHPKRLGGLRSGQDGVEWLSLLDDAPAVSQARRVTGLRWPRWMREHGLEWAWRLALEPRRLARRYLAEGAPAYSRLRLNSLIPGP